ncbi:uncharacterized protein SETTUDRAFT_46001 [Exserohilum turcica Et28A]|uniref:Conserved oligomeric Golgi complex subunit 5 n=1 Tax=Exserohilum turcicum (strain 28A) TaxID=671987 RepID=R0IYU7_EXST2|nr:uncharacterized protein SETTUDRAFT_46001 [Exserohilum turcica Et28A]EOA89940.1 hypothetical protein SETTUDRAFT_46001 [Exserohilum turcica Et28A]
MHGGGTEAESLKSHGSAIISIAGHGLNANTLVLATNNPSDTPLDLSTPLSRVLFDVQEIDTHIDTLTTKSALPLLEHTRQHAQSSARILHEVEGQVASLTEAYKTLEREVIERHQVAHQVQKTAERLCETVKLGRAVARCVMLGRQLEVRMAELGGVGSAKKEDHRAMVRSTDTILALRQILAASKPGEEGDGLDRIAVVNTLRSDLVGPAERSIASRAQQIVKEFSMSSLLSSSTASSASTFTQTEDTKARTTSALLTLYLLSPVPSPSPSSTKTAAAAAATTPTFDPTLMLTALQEYLQTQLKSSLASLARALAQLPSLDRTLLEISARCQNIVALQSLLEATKPPTHPLLSSTSPPPWTNLLQPLLNALDTSSLPSYFWRTLASNMAPRVHDLMNRGGVSARTLKTNRDKVRDLVRECVNRGSQFPSALASSAAAAKASSNSSSSSSSSSSSNTSSNGTATWEREAAVMVTSIIGQIK